MSAYTIVILICSVQIGHSDCRPDTAIDVMRGPKVENAMMCLMAGQALVAQSALAPREGQEYMKIMCSGADRNIRAASRVINTDD